MRKQALLSIHPEHAEAILSGAKSFEFRKVAFRQQIEIVLIYATAPISKVIGSFEVEAIISAEPSAIWEQASQSSGLTRERFDAYYSGKSVAHAIKVINPRRFSRPKPLSTYVKSGTPPQSFCYV